MFCNCPSVFHNWFRKVIAGIIIIILYYPANAQPCLPGWNYRVPVTINIASGEILNNFQVSFTLNTQQLIVDGKLKLDGADMRVRTETGTVIPHWIEPVTFNTASTKVWIKIPVIPVGASTIYLFYGNVAATDISSGSMTFSFFDDFNEGGIDATKWSTCNGGSFNVSDNKLTLTSTSSTSDKAILRSLSSFSGPVTAEMYVNEVAGGGAYIGLANRSDRSGYGLFYKEDLPATMRMVLFETDPDCHLISDQSPSPLSVNALSTTGIWRMTWAGTNEQYIDWPGATIHPDIRTDNEHTFASNSRLVIGHSNHSGSVTIDWVRVRKHHTTEPVATIGVESSLANTAIATTNAPICEGTNLELTSNTVTGADYSWTGPNGFVSNEQNPTITSATAAASGEYTLTISVPSGCTPVTSKVIVRVDETTVAGNLAGGGSVCQGSNSGTLTLSGNIGTPIRWESSSTGFAPWITITSTDVSLAYTNLDKTTYFRTVVKNGVCPEANTSEVLVEVAPAAKGGSIIGPLPVCADINMGTMELIGHIGNIVEWQSSTDNWLTYTVINNTSTSYSFTNLSETTQYRVLIQSGSCPTVFSIPFIMTVHPKPVVAFETEPVCDMQPMSFSNKSTISVGQIASYLWDFGDGSNSIEENPSHLYLNPGIYKVSLKAISTYGCNDTLNKEVIINELPVANFQAKDVCHGNAVTFENRSSISSGSITHLWKFGDGNSSTLFSFEHLYTLPGNYQVILKVTSGAGCIDSITSFINVFALPIVSAGKDTTISRGFGAVLQATGGVNYTWSPIEGLSNSEISNPFANPASTTTYTVYVKDENGCEASDDIIVNVDKDYQLLISNVLTPDGNGSNDTWNIFNIESFGDEALVEVFNRWGRKVYSTNAYRNDWAGTDGTDILPDGTYYYVVSFTGTDKIYKGALTILRNKN